ncbi:hypothetical protein K503DRAFT_772908 [Rhizopogon vinicolor AM-OR11-026]|uniref:Uncharacterized protein n=1 Tax=Rhizopogon vinicolor AM-OR11-026 TaxID=1314800 RepID=A0A1B7MTY5_9AGAM|nr:hypothetical protein K503DRAFT_772908 [Rhizopogon vinicolor AM-OR11-026]
MLPTTDTYKLANAARPSQYISCMEFKIVGKDFTFEPVDEWRVEFHEGSIVTFELNRRRQPSGLYVSFKDGSLIVSEDAFAFSIKEDSPAGTYVIGIPNIEDVWATVSWDNNTPVIVQSHPDPYGPHPTTQLWLFEKACQC